MLAVETSETHLAHQQRSTYPTDRERYVAVDDDGDGDGGEDHALGATLTANSTPQTRHSDARLAHQLELESD